MAKPAQLAGVTLHLIRRGINGMSIFGDDEDFELFLALLEAASDAHDVSVHAYTLMTNHYHLLATPNETNAASRAVQEVNRDYVRHFNKRYQRIGTLWTGRLRDIAITDHVGPSQTRSNLVAVWSGRDRIVIGPRSGHGRIAIGSPTDRLGSLPAAPEFQAAGAPPLPPRSRR